MATQPAKASATRPTHRLWAPAPRRNPRVHAISEPQAKRCESLTCQIRRVSAVTNVQARQERYRWHIVQPLVVLRLLLMPGLFGSCCHVHTFVVAVVAV